MTAFFHNNSLLAAACIAACAAATACGPMNRKPPEKAGSTGQCGDGISPTAEVAPGARAANFSANKAFLIQARLTDAQGTAVEKASLGDNSFTVRLIRVADMSPCSNGVAMTAEYIRQGAHLPMKYPASVKKNDDGTFTVTMTFKRPGTYEITLHVTDGELKDDQRVYATL